MKRLIINSGLLFGLIPFIVQAQQPKADPASPRLIFQSGFEGSTKIKPSKPQFDQIVGLDNSVKGSNNWEASFSPIFENNFVIYYEGGDSTQRSATIIPEKGNPKNHVLYYRLTEAAAKGNSKARIQANMYNGKGVFELFQSSKMMFGEGFKTLSSYDQDFNWLTLSEWWNNKVWGNAPDQFRIKLNVVKKDPKPGSPLNFSLSSQTYDPLTKKFEDIWTEVNTKIEVPVGEWIKIDQYFKEGDEKTGRFYVAITNSKNEKIVLFDVRKATYDVRSKSPDGLKDYNPLKLYTSKAVVDFIKSKGQALEIYWDDLEIWENKRP